MFLHFFRYVPSQSLAVNSQSEISVCHNSPAVTVPSDNPTIRPRRNTSVVSDIVHFPIVDALIMRPSCEALRRLCVQRRVYILQSVSSRALIHINRSSIVIRHRCIRLLSSAVLATRESSRLYYRVDVRRCASGSNATLRRHCDFSLGRSTFH